MTAKHRCRYIGHALRHQFNIGIVPVIDVLAIRKRSETTADISDSIAPSMATVKAGTEQSVDQVGETRNWWRVACRESVDAASDSNCRLIPHRHCPHISRPTEPGLLSRRRGISE